MPDAPATFYARLDARDPALNHFRAYRIEAGTDLQRRAPPLGGSASPTSSASWPTPTGGWLVCNFDNCQTTWPDRMSDNGGYVWLRSTVADMPTVTAALRLRLAYRPTCLLDQSSDRFSGSPSAAPWPIRCRQYGGSDSISERKRHAIG